MRIYPAIHISDERCVNPSANRLNRSRFFGLRPLEMALKWEKQGADFIHVVDMDGARAGSPANSELIREMAAGLQIPLQVGGGIRSIKDIDHYLNMGVARVVIGTQAIEHPVFVREAVNIFGSGPILVSIDARDGMLASEGWSKFSHYNAIQFAANMKAYGVETIIYTDILRRGLDNGLGIMQLKEIIAKLHLNVIYGGGVRYLKDVEAFKDMQLDGLIIGRALYESSIQLSEAIEICRQQEEYR